VIRDEFGAIIGHGARGVDGCENLFLEDVLVTFGWFAVDLNLLGGLRR